MGLRHPTMRAIAAAMLAFACRCAVVGVPFFGGPCLGGLAHAQSLAELRSEVRAEAPNESRSVPETPDQDDDSRRSSRDGASSFDDEQEPLNSLAESLIAPMVVPALEFYLKGLTSPFWGPQKAIGDQFGTIARFPMHPYAISPDAYLVMDPDAEIDGLRFWAARLRGEYGDDFDDLSRIGGQFQLDTTTRFGFDASSEYLRETCGPGQYDDLWLGDANLLFRFAQSERAAFYAGLGLNWLSDRFASDLGFNFTYKIDLFPRRPWVASWELDLGTLGDETYVHTRGSVGLLWRGIETYVGYDWTDVGRYDAGLFIAGVRLWF